MTQLETATITVIEHELNVLRGLRLSQNTAVAEVAVKRERALETELANFRAGITEQGLLPFVAGVEHDEVPLALAASKQSGGPR